MRKLRKLIREKKGTTMAEMLVTLLLIMIMTGMAASSLAAASRIFIRVQKTQYAQSILDTVMTELRTITKNAGSYVKIYENGKNIVDTTGNSSGNAIEFINEEGYVVLLSTDGAKATTLYLGENQIGTAEAVPEGQLLTRYYTRNSSTQTYLYQRENAPAARAVAAVYGKGFYMGNYLKIEYSFPDGTAAGDRTERIIANVALYSDAAYRNLVAQDSESLEFRHPVTCSTAVTAVTE